MFALEQFCIIESILLRTANFSVKYPNSTLISITVH